MQNPSNVWDLVMKANNNVFVILNKIQRDGVWRSNAARVLFAILKNKSADVRDFDQLRVIEYCTLATALRHALKVQGMEIPRGFFEEVEEQVQRDFRVALKVLDRLEFSRKEKKFFRAMMSLSRIPHRLAKVGRCSRRFPHRRLIFIFFNICLGVLPLSAKKSSRLRDLVYWTEISYSPLRK